MNQPAARPTRVVPRKSPAPSRLWRLEWRPAKGGLATFFPVSSRGLARLWRAYLLYSSR